MWVYRLDSVRNYVLAKYNKPGIDITLKNKVSSYFSPETIINDLQLEKVYLENGANCSFLLDEATFVSYFAAFNTQFNRVFSLKKLGKFKADLDKKAYSTYAVRKWPTSFNRILMRHQKKDFIQKMIMLKKDTLRLHREKKDYFDSIILDTMPENLLQSRILSLDFEYNHHDIYEAGFSYFTQGSSYDKYYIVSLKKGTRKNQFQFNFGESMLIRPSQLNELVHQYLKKTDYLLLHGGLNDLFLMAHHGIHLSSYPNIKILDTYHLYMNYFKNTHSSLSNMLQTFKIEHDSLHNAGNDAVYTLKALLHMQEAVNTGG